MLKVNGMGYVVMIYIVLTELCFLESCTTIFGWLLNENGFD